MNMRNIGVVISREYLNKVKKKSFLIITFVVPILLGAFCLLPSLLMLKTKEAAKTIAVVDRSGIVMPYLENTENISYEDYSSTDVESAKAMIGNSGVDVVLSISEIDPEERMVSVETYSAKPMGMDMTESINSRINAAVEDYRIQKYDIEGLKDIMQDVKARVHIKTYTLDSEGKETISESGIYMAVSMLLGMLIYMFVAMFSGMVMSSVIEEKSSRVVEVLVSSVRSIDLMFGKIIGVALVALTQFLLWIILLLLIFGVASIFMGSDQMSSVMAVAGGGADAEAMIAAAGNSMPEGVGVAISTLANMPLLKIFVGFILYFFFGYLLYASLFAAIGASVENEADSQQLQLPITAPLLIGFLVAFYAFKAPDSSLVLWCSMIPFTSPIVMLARLPFGVPNWQFVLSLVLLVLTFVLCAWASAKIYKAGILMFGKKNSWKDLWKWLKMK